MKNLRLLLSAFCVVAAFEAAAAKEGASKPARNDDQDEVVNSWDTDAYFGYAFSMNNHLKNPSTVQFNQGVVPTTTSNDSDDNNNPESAKMGDATLVGVAINYNCCSWFTLGISGELYTPFTYALAHSGATLATGAGTAGTNEILGKNYLRSFTLNHQAFLFNVYFHLPERLAWNVGGVNVTPLIGGGVGVGLNKVTNFQTTGWSTVSTAGILQYTTIALPNLKASVAWQATAGLNFQPEGSDMSFGVTYRFKDEGKFSTGTQYQLNDNANYGKVVTLDAWTGKLRTNEVAMFVNFEF